MPTFQDILAAMITSLQTAKSVLTDFTSTSVVFQILSAVASVIDQIYYSIQTSLQQAFITTATGVSLDDRGQDFGMTRKPATQARWLFEFTKKQTAQQNLPIPLGTMISTFPSEGNPPITFTVDLDKQYLPSGQTSVQVYATCTTSGTIGNLQLTTPMMIASGQTLYGIDGVNVAAVPDPQGNLNLVGTFGYDTESDADYRSRLLTALAPKGAGTAAWYQQMALSVPGVQFASAVADVAGTGKVNIYIVKEGNLTGDDDLLSQVQQVMDTGRIITDTVIVNYPTTSAVDVTLQIQIDTNFNVNDTCTAVTQAVSQYISGLGIGGGPHATLYWSKINAIALGVPGVLNVIAQNPSPADLTFQPLQLPIVGTITVTSV